jgi:hypothetical protein
MRILFFLVTFFLTLFSESIDVVIPIHKKDAKNLDIVIAAVEKHIENVGRIIIISKERFTDKAEWVDEKDFPFSIVDVANEIGGEGGIGDNIRRGWYYQQLLKFYALYVIEDLSDHILILDGDTVPTRDMPFLDEEGRAYLDAHFNRRYICTYKKHTKKILPDGVDLDQRTNPVVHHMVFSKVIMDDLFNRVEEKYGRPFWQVFANLVEAPNGQNSRQFYTGASEYMIYYFFSTHFHPDKIRERFIGTHENAKSLVCTPPKRAWFMSKHNYDRTE